MVTFLTLREVGVYFRFSGMPAHRYRQRQHEWRTTVNPPPIRQGTQRSALVSTRSNTGDGFTVWNHDQGLAADLALYYLIILALRENALERERDTAGLAPVVRPCSHLDGHHAYHQMDRPRPNRPRLHRRRADHHAGAQARGRASRTDLVMRSCQTTGWRRGSHDRPVELRFGGNGVLRVGTAASRVAAADPGGSSTEIIVNQTRFSKHLRKRM